MNLDRILEREVLEEVMTRSLRLYQLHPQDRVLRDAFNSEQMLYRHLFNSFYIPCITCSMPIDIQDLSQGNYD